MSKVGSADGAAPITARPSAPNSRSASRSTSSPLIGDAAGGRRSRLSAGGCRRCRLSSTCWSAAESCSARAASAPIESALRTEGESESAVESGVAGVSAAEPARAPPHAVLSVVPSAAPTNASSRIPWVLVIGSRKNSQGYGSSRSTLQAPRRVVDRSRRDRPPPGARRAPPAEGTATRSPRRHRTPEPYPWEFFRDPMTRTHGIRLLALVGAALGTTLSTACGGARGAGPAALTPATPDSTALSLSPSVRSADSIGALAARAEQDSAADQQVLDSLHRRHPPADSLERRPPAASPIKGEEVEREAERLFGAEGRAVIGAAPSAEPTFDIDVTSFATNRRVLEYLEFFQVDSRDRFEIWLARLGRYQGMIRERLRAKRLPEDLLYLCLIESGFSNTAVSRAKAEPLAD